VNVPPGEYALIVGPRSEHYSRTDRIEITHRSLWPTEEEEKRRDIRLCVRNFRGGIRYPFRQNHAREPGWPEGKGLTKGFGNWGSGFLGNTAQWHLPVSAMVFKEALSQLPRRRPAVREQLFEAIWWLNIGVAKMSVSEYIYDLEETFVELLLGAIAAKYQLPEPLVRRIGNRINEEFALHTVAYVDEPVSQNGDSMQFNAGMNSEFEIDIPEEYAEWEEYFNPIEITIPFGVVSGEVQTLPRYVSIDFQDFIPTVDQALVNTG
jgi:hypothetical protein